MDNSYDYTNDETQMSIGLGKENKGPRKQLRVFGNRTQTTPQQENYAYQQRGTLLSDIPSQTGIAQLEEPVISNTQQPHMNYLQNQNIVPANTINGTLQQMSVDPYTQGIKIESNGSRIHNKTPEFMKRQGRIIDRISINPYTGKKEYHYRQLPPDGNQDRRIPKEMLEQANLRLVYAQGYDASKPKQQRKEVYNDLPQPDSSHMEAAIQDRIRGEMRERVSRDLYLNKNGERPTWMRDTQRAFGYNGYQPTFYPVPHIPITMRADTKNLKPGEQQTPNPTPTNEAWLRENHRTNAKRAHVEKVDWRSHPAAQEHAQISVGSHEHIDTKRSQMPIDKQFQPAPKEAYVHSQPKFGETSETHRKTPYTRNTDLFKTNQMVGVGGGNDSNASIQRVYKGEEREGHKYDRVDGAVPLGYGILGSPFQNGHALSGNVQQNDQKRDGTIGDGLFAKSKQVSVPTLAPIHNAHNDHLNQKRTYIPVGANTTHTRGDNNATLPPMLSGSVQHHDQKRQGQVAPVPGGLASAYQGPQAQAQLPDYNDHLITKREDNRQDTRDLFIAPSDDRLGHTVKHNAVHDHVIPHSNDYLVESGEMSRGHRHADIAHMTDAPKVQTGMIPQRVDTNITKHYNHKEATHIGDLVYGDDTKIESTGKRGLIAGERPAVSWLHGAADNSTVAVGRQSFIERDRTITRNLNSEYRHYNERMSKNRF